MIFKLKMFQVSNFDTLPETNVAPENGPLEKEIPIGNHDFQVLCWFQGG